MTHSLADEAMALEAQHRSNAERQHEADEQGRADIEGHVFLYRDAMEAFLRSAHRVRVDRSLTPGEVMMIKGTAIKLWGEHARQHDIGVKIITEEHYQLVSRAEAQQAAAVRPLTLHQVRRDLDRLLPGQCTTPANDRKLERRSY